MTATYVPAPEARTGDQLEHALARLAEGWDTRAQIRALSHPSWRKRKPAYDRAVTDALEALRARDQLIWDAARAWGQDADLLCQRADEALLVLRLGRRGGN